MTELQQALFSFAQNQRIDAMLTAADQQELADNAKMEHAAMERLNTLDSSILNDIQRVVYSCQVRCTIYQEASFLVGLSIGLELSRL